MKGGLGGISETVWPNTISWPGSRFLFLPAPASNHVLFEQSEILKPEIRRLILDRSSVNDMYAAAIGAQDEIMAAYAGRRAQFLFTGMKGPGDDLVA